MERLRILRKNNNLSMKELGKVIGVAESTISLYENGKREPDNNTLSLLADFFNVSIDYLLERDKNSSFSNIDLYNIKNIHPITVQKIPMLGSIACGQPIYANEEKESYVQVGTEINADFCLTARGDSMIGARIQDGDIVFCKAQNTVENGEIAVVLINDEATLKRVYFYPDKQKLVLQAENPKYEPFVYINEELADIKILGKAIAFQSDVK